MMISENNLVRWNGSAHMIPFMNGNQLAVSEENTDKHQSRDPDHQPCEKWSTPTPVLFQNRRLKTDLPGPDLGAPKLQALQAVGLHPLHTGLSWWTRVSLWRTLTRKQLWKIGHFQLK